jgi:alkylation response protein AidB-like acyl-CoA dehydrogenase
VSSPLDLRPLRAFLEPRHHELAAHARDVVGREIAPLPPPGTDDAAREQARAIMHALGHAELLAPIESQDVRGCCIVREILAEATPLADAVFALQALGTTPLLIAGSTEQRHGWAKGAIRGKAMGAFAMTEVEAGSDAGAMQARARRDGADWILDGAKTLISNGGLADFYVVFASTDPGKGAKGVSAFLVPASTTGFRFVRPLVMSSPHPLGEVAFEGCRVPGEALLGGEGGGMKLALGTLDRLRATVGAAACGMAGRALEEALAHAARRVQFGKPLAEFQIVQQKIACMATELRAARFLVYQAAWEKDQGAERITLESGMAKAYATEAAQRIVDDAVQVIGGRGVLADHPVDRLYRSIRALRIYEGTTEIQHLLIAGQLLAQRRT